MNHEDLLRETLSAKAAEASVGLTLDDVRRDVARHRARRRMRIALAAAAVVAVTVPTAVLMRPGSDEPGPAPSPAPSLAPSPAPSVPTATGLDAIPRGADPHIAYLQDGVVHQPDGSTSRLPADATDVVAFTPYHGGWIVLDSAGGLTQYDNAGVVVRQGGSDSGLVVSADGMRTAFWSRGHLRVGISSGMGEGESDHQIGAVSGLVGFLGDRVVYNATGSVHAMDGAGRVSAVPALTMADATSPDGDLVAGRGADDGTIEVVSASTGQVRWRKPGWFSADFSPDGRYLSAYRTATGGEFETVAILDARTGAVVATSKTPSIQALPAPPTAWEEDDHLLIPYRGGSSWAVLRLSSGGEVERATEVVTDTSPDLAPFVFAARP